MGVWLESHLGHQLGRNSFCNGRKVEVVSLFQSIGSGQRWDLSSMLPKLACSNIQKRVRFKWLYSHPIRGSISRIFAGK